jgi:O-antigen/teichoic acid export membrane protein
MLIGQASINLTANILSALLGLVSVSIFTRLFSPHDYGVYLLGVGFASVISVFLVGWFRNLILSGHARDDGADVRGLVASGFSICCLSTPIAYVLGRLVGMDGAAALATVGLSITLGLFDVTQDLIRAKLKAVSVMRGTLARAVVGLGLGVVVALVAPAGYLLLASASAACLLAVLLQSGTAWRGAKPTFDRSALAAVARKGLPLTLSLTLLAISSVTDRLAVAALVGAADAGKYVASLDLVRQTLMLPALSAAAAFFPLAVRIHASKGDAAVRAHLAECVELLFAIVFPAALGLAVISPHIANIVLGENFRDVATRIMPIVAIAAVFQILTQQYLHASFLLSGRNSYYLINTASIIAANLVLCLVLIESDGAIGAAWARLGADAIGFACALLLSRRAFPVPLPIARLGLIAIASLIMAITVAILNQMLHVSDLTACLSLAGSGVLLYAALCWLFDVADLRGRARRAAEVFRERADVNIGSPQ